MLRHDKNHSRPYTSVCTATSRNVFRLPSGVASDAESINLILSGLLLVKYDCAYGSCSGTSSSWYSWKPEKEPTRAYRICVSIHRSDPCPGFRMSFFFFFLGRGIKFRYCSCSRPWALCNQLAHCTGAVEVVMGPQIRPLESSYILVKKMHAGLGLNTESFKCLLCRTLLSGNYSLNSHHYPMLILWYYIMVIRWGYPY